MQLNGRASAFLSCWEELIESNKEDSDGDCIQAHSNMMRLGSSIAERQQVQKGRSPNSFLCTENGGKVHCLGIKFLPEVMFILYINKV